MLRRYCQGLAGLALLLLGTSDLCAQAVRGRLLDAGSGDPVAGALIVLLDSDGGEIGGTVTSARGTYHVRAPGAGVFRLRAERIGFENSLSDTITLLAGQTVSREITASSSAVVLPALAVESDTECRVRPEEGYAAYVVWEEARKALEITEGTSAAYRFDAEMYQKLVNLWGQPLEEGEVQLVSYAGRHPFRSVSMDELDEHGYARVGLAFEPIREESDRVDVEGVMWLDRESSLLRTLEFRYTGVDAPAHLGTGPGPYGEVVFDQLPGGGWIIREWWIRTPTGSRERGVQRYVTYAQQGGRVNHTERLGASPADMRPVPSVYGPPTVADSSGAR